MEGLTSSEISELLAPRAKKVKTPTGVGSKFDSDGWKVLESTSEVGKFEGRAGTIKRNRKGRTSRLPNGSRWYPKWLEHEVLAYKLK